MTQHSTDRWQLPDGVDELLPDAAWQVENLRRRIIDRCRSWGFELVMPPMIEYLDSLLTGTGETMDLQTFKLVDQQNGRSMGIRADMTPQVARMDAHALRGDHPNRLFYTGSVLRARTDGFGGSRSPLQFGAELFGHAGVQSDIEIIRLMLATLAEANLETADLILDLGHVGIYRGLVSELQLSDDVSASLFNSVQRGSTPDVQALLRDVCNEQQLNTSSLLEQLMNMRGDEHLISDARDAFGSAPAVIHEALDSLQQVVEGVRRTHPEIGISIDLAELRGYSYHTGVLFAAYTKSGDELARGGRYDAVGAAFGHPRPATGFSGDMKKLADAVRLDAQGSSSIFVSADLVEEAWPEIARLRENGERVLTELVGMDGERQALACDRILVQRDNGWRVVPRS